ncbi:hypothetical protein EDD99_6450 [Streptomyces sp. 846.5]|nr:hypothetical protein [Streptomyces sp. 846.5]TDT98230.1 hypothetical protein EDD99_6450 [Streptomyces sp. 846.5]
MIDLGAPDPKEKPSGAEEELDPGLRLGAPPRPGRHASRTLRPDPGRGPPELQGRAQTTGMWLAFALQPLAALLAGVLGTLAGLRPTLTVITGLLMVPIWMLWRSPIRHLHELPGTSTPIEPVCASAARTA